VSDAVARLRDGVVAPLKGRFVGRSEVVDLIALAVVAGEHLFLLGPPGTAKSALIRGFASAVRGEYFEYLLTRFSEPNEVFGPVDLAKLREGRVATVTTGMLPEAEFAFLDELFNANSAILNNLLTVLNERVYRRGAETHRLPLLALFAASNHLPEDEALGALFDRFLLRCKVDPLPRNAMLDLLRAGWALEHGLAGGPADAVSADDLRALAGQVLSVDLSAVMERYADLVFRARDLGVGMSDRRAVKVLKLVAASAVICGRDRATPADFWVLRYCWDREEQIGPLAALVNGVLEQEPEGSAAHPLARPTSRVDPEELARELDAADRELEADPANLTVLARLRERVSAAADRSAWVADERTRHHLAARAAELLDRIGG
jgi:MoxR-like ATPase